MASFRILAYSKSQSNFKCLLSNNNLPTLFQQEFDINSLFGATRILVGLLEEARASLLNWENLQCLEPE